MSAPRLSKRARPADATPKAAVPMPAITPTSASRAGPSGGPVLASSPMQFTSMISPQQAAQMQMVQHQQQIAQPPPQLPQLPTTADHNLLGKKLADTWRPREPVGQLLLPVRIEIDGSQLTPPQERSYHDEIIWNAFEPGSSITEFARLTCEDEDLPPQFGEEIAKTIHRAIEQQGATRPPAGILPLKIDVVRNGVRLEDRVLWNTSDKFLTPEMFAKMTVSDLGLGPEFEMGVAFAVREQLLLHARGLADTSGLEERPSGTVVRSEKASLNWTPIVRRDGEPPDGVAADALGAERRDRYRERQAPPPEGSASGEPGPAATNMEL